MRKDLEKVVNYAMAGVVAIAGYELIKGTVLVIKNKKALQGIKDDLDKVGDLVNKAKEEFVHEEEIH